jgi:hypothetical protein
MQASCASPAFTPPTVSLSSNRGTVQSPIGYTLRYYPIETSVALLWDGKSLGSVATTASGTAASSLPAPAAPMGTHQLQWTAGNWRSAASFTIVPRIKLIPSAVSRGQTVNVSLRGYAARELVRIRWKKGSSWVELARVTTSSTGSANVYIKVPTWAPSGAASVRGDGSFGRAQTNAVIVSGGPFLASTVKTPTPTATASPTPAKMPSPTSTPNLIVPTASSTIEPIATSEPATATPGVTAPPDASPVAVTP